MSRMMLILVLHPLYVLKVDHFYIEMNREILENVLQSFSHRNVCKNMHLYMIITWVYFVPSN